jgi:phosphoglycerate dehydrogenase-like enzyme
MKPHALYIIEPRLLNQVYDAGVREQLARSLSFARPMLTASDITRSTEIFHEVEVILTSWGMPRLEEPLLARFPKLKAVFYGAGSVRDFVTIASWSRGVRIVNASAANAVPAAEFAFAQIVLCLKQAWQLAVATRRKRNFSRDTSTLAGTFGSTVGLLALGQIGRLVAERLKSLSVSILAYDPLIAPGEANRIGVRLCSLDEVFAQSDVISCHLPLLTDTEGLLRRPQFEAMKPGASFINTARGAVVAEDELIAVLRERPDLLAVLDVTDPEPPAVDSPLFDLPNVVLTPHMAGCVGPECRRLGASIAQDVARYVRGEPLANEITPASVLTRA